MQGMEEVYKHERSPLISTIVRYVKKLQEIKDGVIANDTALRRKLEAERCEHAGDISSTDSA
jgi:hypothetical protein